MAASKSSGSNRTRCHDPLVSVDLEDAEKFDRGMPQVRSWPEIHVRAEVETIAAGRSDGRRNIRESRRQLRPRMSAMAASRPYVIPEFTTRRRSSIANVVGQNLGERVPVMGRNARREARRALRSPRFPAAASVVAALRISQVRHRGLSRRIAQNGLFGRLRQSGVGSSATRLRSLPARSHAVHGLRRLRSCSS